MLWHIGNTTVRTPYRLRDALIVLQDPAFNGNIGGRTQENAFAVKMHHEGVVDADRVRNNKDVSDLGRKWRSALSQLGFITPQLTRSQPSGTQDPELLSMIVGADGLSGRPYEITPNGHRLLNADSVAGQQECFLRSLASYQLPSILESRATCQRFSPLRLVLQVFKQLEAQKLDERLSFNEFALFVQRSTPGTGVNSVVERIRTYRKEREKAKGKVRAFDREIYKRVAVEEEKQESTLRDYADLTFRYLKATGLFRAAGHGISVTRARSELAMLIAEENNTKFDDRKYLHSIWLGAKLPTDDSEVASAVVKDLARQLKARGEVVELPADDTPLADLQILRHEFEDKLFQLDELDFASAQANSIEEITGLLELVPSQGKLRLSDGRAITIPKGEGPAYLEWAVWRAFLAINSLSNHPWESRRFQIDQDFLPVNCAPGGGPDMVFEFETYILVVEVTLTRSSRQEAAEGEPVRRHVASYVSESEKKPVYGLFVAVDIDSNTANTFKSGDWYLPNDKKLSLHIVPLTLDSFRSLLVNGQHQLKKLPEILRQVLLESRALANQDAPQWKSSIKDIVERTSQSLSS